MKMCRCIKDWKGYKVGDETFYLTGKTWFVGGTVITISEFKEHFEPINTK